MLRFHKKRDTTKLKTKLANVGWTVSSPSPDSSFSSTFGAGNVSYLPPVTVQTAVTESVTASNFAFIVNLTDIAGSSSAFNSNDAS